MELVQIPLDGNEQKILQIYADVYADTPDRIPSLHDLRWRFGGTPYPVHIWVAREHEKIIGLRPIMIKPIKLGSNIYPALQMLDVMVHPAYQGKGIFKSLMEKAWSSHAAEGVLAFTFPNENSIKAYRKWSDWFPLAEIPLFVRTTAPRRLSDPMKAPRIAACCAGHILRFARSQMHPPARVAVQQIREPDARLQKLWESVKDLYDVIVPRDLQYLRWRYFDRPDVHYVNYIALWDNDIVGFLAARTRFMFGMQLGLIVDFLVNDNDRGILSALLHHAVAELVKKGVHAIGLQFVGPDELKQALLDQGFFRVPKRFLPREFFMYARYGGHKIPELDITALKRRFHTWGDNDAV